MKKVQNKGFTLIELIFVLVILAIIACIVVATYPGLLHTIRIKADKSSAKNISNGIRAWYVDYSTDTILKSELEEIITTTGMKQKTVMLTDMDESLKKYLDINGLKPVSLLNENKIKEPIQNFFVGIIETGVGIRIVVSVGVDSDDAKDISSLAVDADSDTIAIYDGYESGIIYVEPK